MVDAIPFRTLLQDRDGSILPDYAEMDRNALSFFAGSPLDFESSLSMGGTGYFRREDAAASLVEYNTGLCAGEKAITNAAAIADAGTFCVITGQQAEFLGGPVFTAYKIITAIRLARYLSETYGIRAVPVFWIASEDHDFHEINRVYYQKPDGEIGKITFPWARTGNSLYDLPLDAHQIQAFHTYLQHLDSDTSAGYIRSIYKPKGETEYCSWQAGIWSSLFERYGLVIADPRCFRPYAGIFYSAVFSRQEAIRKAISEAGEAMAQAGYRPALTNEQTGMLYTYDGTGRRVRIDDRFDHQALVYTRPSTYSTDVAIRPVLADAALPVAASVLGPGELQYMAQLREVYRLLEVPQPVIFPRKSYTVLSKRDLKLCEKYGVDPGDILLGKSHLQELIPIDDHLSEQFEKARSRIEEALSPLRPQLAEIDPNLVKTWTRTLDTLMFRLRDLEYRTQNAVSSQKGYEKRELRAFINRIRPLHSLQERIFPLPHFFNRNGTDFLENIMKHGELNLFEHIILEL